MENYESERQAKCSVKFWCGGRGYSAYAPDKNITNEAKDTQKKIKELYAYINEGRGSVFYDIRKGTFEDIKNDLSPENISIGTYNMQPMIEALEEEMNVLTKDYNNILEEMQEIADAYYNATCKSYQLCLGYTQSSTNNED